MVDVNYTVQEIGKPVAPSDNPIAETVNPIYNARWDDLRFPFTPDKQVANTKPDFDYTNLGLLFPRNDATEQSNMIVQLVTGVSAFMDVILYREDDVATGDVLVKEFDLHYIKDELGSRQEYTK